MMILYLWCLCVQKHTTKHTTKHGDEYATFLSTKAPIFAVLWVLAHWPPETTRCSRSLEQFPQQTLWAWYHGIGLPRSLLCTAVIILYHLAHSLYVLHIDLKPATTSEASPSTCHIHLECWPYRQGSEQLHSVISQWALSCAPIGQYRSCDPLFFIPRRVYLVSLLYYLLNISLSLDHGIIEPHGLQAPLVRLETYYMYLYTKMSSLGYLNCETPTDKDNGLSLCS